MLIDDHDAIGFFVGLSEGGLNFDAELTLTYNHDFQNRAMVGQFVLISLDSPDQAILARITAIASHGKLASLAGEDLGARSVQDNRIIPEDLKRQFLRYRCSVRLMGIIKEKNSKIVFTPSHRRLPHMGAKVIFPNERAMRFVAGAERSGQHIGFYALGEFIFAEGHPYATRFDDRFSIESPCIEPRFDVTAMVARRTAVLARSGYGKSNLLKLLFARLYESTPMVERDGKLVPVGTIVFDPDGDYFWPGSGHNAPPGLCDLPALRDRIVVVTDRKDSRPFYDAFRTTSPRFDLRELSAHLVLPLVLSDERMNHRGTEAMLRMSDQLWRILIDAAWLEHTSGKDYLTEALIRQLCGLRGNAAEVSAMGIRSSIKALVAQLHNPDSHLVEVVDKALKEGKLVIVDLSLMRGDPATELSAILLRHLFQHNVREYTKANSGAVPIIALVEEAQTVLAGRSAKHGPFVEWVKEGRKYELGAVLVTQQPGAIDNEILSQTDNFFAFHLISGGDLRALKDANGHFSDDVLASLLNEPIEGQGYMWSSAGADKSTYPIPFRAYDLGALHQRMTVDELKNAPTNFYAARLRAELKPKPPADERTIQAAIQAATSAGVQFPAKPDITDAHRALAEEAKGHRELGDNFKRGQIPLFAIEKWLTKEKKISAKQKRADTLAVLTVIFGLHGYGWLIETKASQAGKQLEWAVERDSADGLRRLDAGEQPIVAAPAVDTDSNADELPTDDDLPF